MKRWVVAGTNQQIPKRWFSQQAVDDSFILQPYSLISILSLFLKQSTRCPK